MARVLIKSPQRGPAVDRYIPQVSQSFGDEKRYRTALEKGSNRISAKWTSSHICAHFRLKTAYSWPPRTTSGLSTSLPCL